MRYLLSLLLVIMIHQVSASTGDDDLKDMSEQELLEVVASDDEVRSGKAHYYLASRVYKDSTELALKHVDKAIKSLSIDTEARAKAFKFKAKLLITQGRLEEAMGVKVTFNTDHADDQKSKDYAEFYSGFVGTLMKVNEMAIAEEVLQEMDQIAKETGSIHMRFKSLENKGKSYWYKGDLNQAGIFFNKAIEMATSDIDPGALAGMKMNVAIIQYRNGNYRDSKLAFRGAIKSFSELDDELNQGHAYINMASVYSAEGDIDSTEWAATEALKLYGEVGNRSGEASAYEYLGNNIKAKGDFAGALEYHLKALEIREELKDDRSLTGSYVNIAAIYEEMRDFDEQYRYLKLAERAVRKAGSDYSMARLRGYLAIYFRNIEQYDSSLFYLKKKLEFFETQGNPYDIASTNLSMGNTYKHMEMTGKALSHYLTAYELFDEIGDKVQKAGLAHNIGVIHLEAGRAGMALKYIDESFEFRKNSGNMQELVDAHKVYSNAYRDLQQWEKAYEHMRLYADLKDTLFFSVTMNERLAEMRTKFETQLIEDSLAIANQEKEAESIKAKNAELASKKADAERVAEQQKVWMFGGLSILLLLGGGFIVRTARQRKKDNIALKDKNQQISSQNIEISLQKDMIEEKNKDILDSITYAKRLQEAILPPAQLVKENLEDSFILFKPKDIVSGDFYWMLPVDGKVYYAAVDCTGHGVPGAMVSVVGHNGLNRTVKEFGMKEPAKILDKLNELVIETFSQGGSTDVRDGMDLALCCLLPEKRELHFAGANNPIWIVSKAEELDINGSMIKPAKIGDSGMNLFEVKGDKQPIGAYEDRKPFTNSVIKLNPGDAAYTFSDGYADQFGGTKGKKFKYVNFKKLLLEVQDLPMSEQKEKLDSVLEDWKSSFEQVDDICVIGVRV